MSRTSLIVRRLVVAVPLLVGLIGSTTTVITATPASAGPVGSAVSAPITTALVQGGDTWLVVPMGKLSHLVDTFWQLFVRAPTDTGWVTVTPPGVADNGGLVITAGPGGGLLAGFLASQDLTFSPLSLTTDGGRNWTAVYFPQGLIAVPDALGVTTGGTTVGLGRSGKGGLFETGSDLSSLTSWRPDVTAARLGRSTAGARCGVVRLTATAVAPDGDPLLGAACSHAGIVGLFDVAGGGAKAVAFPDSASLTGATVSVLRLVATTSGVAVLLGARERTGRTVLVAGWLSSSGPAVAPSAPLAVPAGAKLLASGTTPGGGLFVLLQPAGATAPELADVSATATGEPTWDVPPRPPRGTLGAAFSPGRIDAVTVHSSTLIDYAFDESSATWVRAQVVHVPIQYGSSS
jgi:hypothetical protein